MNIFNIVIMMFETFISIMFIFLILDYTSKENIIRFMIFWIGEMIISIMYNYHFLTDYTLLFVEILYYLGITHYLSRKDIFNCFFVAILNNILLLFSNAFVLVTVNSISYMITYNIYSNNLVNFISKVVFLLLSFIFHKYFKKYIFEIKIHKTFDILITSMLILYIIIFNTIFVKKTFVLSSLIELIILNVFVYFMYKFFIQNIQLQNETFTNQLIIQELKNKEKDYHRLIKNEEKLKTIKHDMKHHLLYLLDCYENNNENFEKELKKEIANLTKLETSVNTGVSSLDYIISSKREIFQEKNIQFICNHYNGDIIFDKLDSYIIFGNLIDNAIENCSANPSKKIIIDLNQDNEYVYIKIKNTINYPVLKYNPQLISKKGTAEHGIGLSSVKSTLKKYKSEISFSEDKYWFTVLIVIDKYEYIH